MMLIEAGEKIPYPANAVLFLILAVALYIAGQYIVHRF